MRFSETESPVFVRVLVDQTGCAEDSGCAIMLKIHLLEPKTPERAHQHNRAIEATNDVSGVSLQIRFIRWLS